jgi:MOB kinase activator 1
MFVSNSSHMLPSFPAKPKPLQPIFTFAQSQSCMNLGVDMVDALHLPRTLQSSPRLPPIGGSSACGFPNYSYKLLPGSSTPTTRGDLIRDWDGCPGQASSSTAGMGTVSSPSTRAQMRAPPRNNGYFTGTSLLSAFLSSNPRTRAPFKPQKSNRGTSSWQLKQYAEATLGSGSLRKAVKLPEGEDKDEWLAVNGTQMCFEGNGTSADIPV